MGKESKLRNRKPESRYNHANGDRKLYDRDAMPDGLDSDIWNFTLYFEQLAEDDGYKIPGRPIVYTELYSRVSKDPDLCLLLRSDDVQYTHARTTGICGIIPDETTVTGIQTLILNIIAGMILNYWNINNGFDYGHNINDFCSVVVFDYLKKYVTDSIKRDNLRKTGIRVPLTDKGVKPSRKTEEQKQTYEILNRPRTEEESKGKIEHWKRDTSQHS